MSVIKSLALLIVLVNVQAAPPKYTGEASEDYTGLAEYFKSLKCNIEGGTKYEWFHNGTKIPQNSDKFFMFSNQLYPSESPVSTSYQGTYQCKASNEDGTLLGPKINVLFSILGKFFKSPDDVGDAPVTVGKDLSLACPPRTLSRNIFYHWGKMAGITGVWLLPGAKHYMIMNDGTLLFANVKDEDLELFNVVKNGISCIIEWKGGDLNRMVSSQRFLLREVGERNTKPFGPFIKTALEDREVAKGTEFVVFRCGAVGLPTPAYSWKFTGVNGAEREIKGGEDGYELEDYNHVLMITSVESKHDGWYTCRVSSSYDGQEHTDQKSARLSVKGKPEWTANGQLSPAIITEGQDFEWSCQAFGNPDPTYTWLKNGELITESAKYEINGGMLALKSALEQDEGIYQCLAENEFGVISTDAVLTVEPAPTTTPLPTTEPPLKCSVTKMNLMFLVDGSGSVPSATFREFKRFMSLLVEKFDIGPDTTHVGVLQYSSKPNTGLEFHFSEHETLAAVQDAISKVVYHYGAYTFGGYAMNLAQQIMNHYDRTDAKNVWVLLMDDGLWDKTLARKISKSLRQSGTKIIILDTKNPMHDIADHGLDFSTENLQENVDLVAEEICK